MEAENAYAEQEDTMYGKYLTFSLGQEEFGIDIQYVTEIVGIQPITAMPEVPDYFKGIINLRGKIISVIDMRLRFNMEPAAYTDRTCVIVLDMPSVSIGLIVDNVSEVLTIDDENIITPPALNPKLENRFISNLAKTGSSVKLILDCDKLSQDIGNC